MSLFQNEYIKTFRSADYNFVFDKRSGFHARWGATRAADPDWAPFNEILDIEVTTQCRGGCGFCYKANTPDGSNMSLATFKGVIDRMPEGLTQIALGADYDLSANPDIFTMMAYARERGIIPNITLAYASEDTARKLAAVCGAVAVSRYANKTSCYTTVERLSQAGLKQVNIHQMVSAETLQQARETAGDIPGGPTADPRLAGLNALVFLSLKPKGRGETFTPLRQEDFDALVGPLMDARLNFGMDSCSAQKFLNLLEARRDPAAVRLRELVEPCEASLFSAYVDVRGHYYPCSFAPGTPGWEQGLDVLAYQSFEDVWNHERVKEFRTALLAGGRHCPLYRV